MQEVLFIDAYFLINLALDFLALYLTSRLKARNVPFHSLILSSIICASFSILEILIPLYSFYKIFLFIFFISIACLLAFKPPTITDLLSITINFFLTLVLLGGSIHAIQSLGGTMVQSQTVDWITVLFIFALAPISFLYLSTANRRTKQKYQNLCIIINASALIDTGNLLRHPTSGDSVALIGLEAAAHLFSKIDSPPELNEQICIQTPAGRTQLFGFFCYESYVRKRGKQKRIKPFFLALDPHTKNFGGCDLLISPYILL